MPFGSQYVKKKTTRIRSSCGMNANFIYRFSRSWEQALPIIKEKRHKKNCIIFANHGTVVLKTQKLAVAFCIRCLRRQLPLSYGTGCLCHCAAGGNPAAEGPAPVRLSRLSSPHTWRSSSDFYHKYRYVRANRL